MIKLDKKAFEPLDEEEKELMEAIENDELVSLGDLKEFETEMKEAIKNTFEKKKKITLNLIENDLMKIKAEALKQGLPYQTYISSILHKVASNF